MSGIKQHVHVCQNVCSHPTPANPSLNMYLGAGNPTAHIANVLRKKVLTDPLALTMNHGQNYEQRTFHLCVSIKALIFTLNDFPGGAKDPA